MSFTLLDAHIPDVQAEEPVLNDTIAFVDTAPVKVASDEGEVSEHVPDVDAEISSESGAEDDWDEISKGRYFAENASTDALGPLCHNCKAPGHKRKDCPHQLCRSCGALDDHDTIRCPMTQRCYNCSRLGHVATKCPEPPRQQGSYCRECGSRSHLDRSCPQIWRLYLPSPNFDPNGDWNITAWCYNCAAKGHYGDDCPKPHRARLIEQSAFCMANQPESRRAKQNRVDQERTDHHRRKREVARDIKDDWFLRQNEKAIHDRRNRRYDPYARPQSNPIITSERFPRGMPSARGKPNRFHNPSRGTRGHR